jgi:hypothetical protein
LGEKPHLRVRIKVDNTFPDSAWLDECLISFIGAGAPAGNYVSRAVITLSRDLTPFMEHLSRQIENSGYNTESKTLAFRWEGMPVVVVADTITINAMRDRATAQRFIGWLKEKLKTAG